MAKALADAAGAAATGSDDTDLFEAAQAEYERYFTLKAGKFRCCGRSGVRKGRTALEAAQQALAEVETTAQAHERSVTRKYFVCCGIATSERNSRRTWQELADD